MITVKRKRCLNPSCVNWIVTYTRRGNIGGEHMYCSRECWSAFPPSLYDFFSKYELDPSDSSDFKKLLLILETPLRDLSRATGRSMNTIRAWRSKSLALERLKVAV